MAKPFEPYVKLKVETYHDPHLKRLRVRPLPGQGYPTNIVVECPRSMRKNHPPGTRFEITAKLTDREEGGEYFYSHHSWPYKVIE